MRLAIEFLNQYAELHIQWSIANQSYTYISQLLQLAHCGE